MSSFTRPLTLEFPTIYHTFIAKDCYSKSLTKYTIQDLPEDRYEEAIQFMIQHFMEDEVMGKTRKIKTDQVAIKEMSDWWRFLIKKRMSVVCFKESSYEIVSLNILTVKSKGIQEVLPIVNINY